MGVRGSVTTKVRPAVSKCPCELLNTRAFLGCNRLHPTPKSTHRRRVVPRPRRRIVHSPQERGRTLRPAPLTIQLRTGLLRPGDDAERRGLPLPVDQWI